MRVLFLSSGRHESFIVDAVSKQGVTIMPMRIGIYAILQCMFGDWDLIHSDSLLDTGFLAALFGWGKKKTVIVRGYGGHLQKHKRFSLLKALMFTVAEYVSLWKTDYLFFVSQDCQDQMLKYYHIKQKNKVVYNGINNNN